MQVILHNTTCKSAFSFRLQVGQSGPLLLIGQIEKRRKIYGYHDSECNTRRYPGFRARAWHVVDACRVHPLGLSLNPYHNAVDTVLESGTWDVDIRSGWRRAERVQVCRVPPNDVFLMSHALPIKPGGSVQELTIVLEY